MLPPDVKPRARRSSDGDQCPRPEPTSHSFASTPRSPTVCEISLYTHQLPHRKSQSQRVCAWFQVSMLILHRGIIDPSIALSPLCFAIYKI